MKKLLVVVGALLGCALPMRAGTWSDVTASDGSMFNFNSSTCVLSFSVHAGDLVYDAVTDYSAATDTLAAAVGTGETVHTIATLGGGSTSWTSGAWWIAAGAAETMTVTITTNRSGTPTATENQCANMVARNSGGAVSSTAAMDQCGNDEQFSASVTTGDNSCSSGSLTASGEIAIASIINAGSGVTSVGSGYTAWGANNCTSGVAVCIEYSTSVPASGSASMATWTDTFERNDLYLATFFAPSGGGGGPSCRHTLLTTGAGCP